MPSFFPMGGGVRKSLLLKTGQTTEYVAGDNGTNQKGVAKSYTVLTAGQYAGSTNITINSKTEAKANACVQDNNTGLMWCRSKSASVGPASDGKLPWTTTGSGATAEGIWPYVAAANAASLAGYADWRIPNIYELMSLANFEATTASPDGTAFPTLASVAIWSSTTLPSTTANALPMNYATGGISAATAKTTTNVVILVRG